MARSFLLALALLAARTATAFKLYAYGTGIGGLQVYQNDGQAFIATTMPSDGDVTFSQSGSTLPATFSSDSSPTTSHLFALPNTATSFSNIVFTDSATAPPTDMTTDGFIFYGATLMHTSDSSGALETNFYAVPTSTDGVWSVMWKGDDATSTGTVVSLRTAAPSNAKVRSEFVA